MNNKKLIINGNYEIPIISFNEAISRDSETESGIILNFGVTILNIKNDNSTFLTDLIPFLRKNSITSLKVMDKNEDDLDFKLVFETNQYTEIEGSSIDMDQNGYLQGAIGFSRRLNDE